MRKNYSEVVRRVDFSKSINGLLPVIIQDSSTNVVLMLGFMNKEVLEENIET